MLYKLRAPPRPLVLAVVPRVPIKGRGLARFPLIPSSQKGASANRTLVPVFLLVPPVSARGYHRPCLLARRWRRLRWSSVQVDSPDEVLRGRVSDGAFHVAFAGVSEGL